MIGDQVEVAALRERSGFILQRAILKMKGQPAVHAAATSSLFQIPVCDHRAGCGGQSQETMNLSFGVAHCNWLARQIGGRQKCQTTEDQREMSETRLGRLRRV